jgi:hypothetical protein
MLLGKHGRYSSRSRWHKFKQERPSETQWKVWRKANLLWSKEDGTLHQPLMRWRHGIAEQRRIWHAYGGDNGKIYIIVAENGSNDSIEDMAYLVVPTEAHNHVAPMLHIISMRELTQTAICVHLPSDVTPLDVAEVEEASNWVIKVQYDIQMINQVKPRTEQTETN